MDKNANRVVIVMSGGSILNVASSDPAQVVVVHDWDDVEEGRSPSEGQKALDFVSVGCIDRPLISSIQAASEISVEVNSIRNLIAADLHAPNLSGDFEVAMRYQLDGDDFSIDQVGTINNSSDVWRLHISPGTAHEVVVELPSLSNEGWAEMEACYGSFKDAVHAALRCEVNAVCNGERVDVMENLVKLDLEEARSLFSIGGRLEVLIDGLPVKSRAPAGIKIDVSECEIANLASLLGDRACAMESSLASLDDSDWERFTLVVMKIRDAKRMT